MIDFNPFSLEGKTILVTGASSGIGRGIAVACSKMGAMIILNGRNLQKLEVTLSELKEGKHQVIAADLTNYDSVIQMLPKLPKLDGIVHCAGIGQRIPCKDIRCKNVDEVMDVNFKAPILLQSELLRQKKLNRGASIVFIASIASWSPSIGNSVYSASKGAIISFAKCLSLELASRQIRVNCISPAMVWTDLILQDGVDEEQLKEDESKYPLKRYGTPEDIANVVEFLASEKASYTTPCLRRRTSYTR